MSADGDEELVLLGRKTGGASSVFTEVEEAAETGAEGGEGAVVVVAEWLFGHLDRSGLPRVVG
jgi:hypothetical protein